MLIEVCVDNIESVYTAQKCGANRIELCGALALGGADVAALPLALEATLYGEPETFELEVGRRVGNFSFAAGLRWERWEGLATSALSVRARLPEGKVRRTGSANVRFRDTLSPAASVSYAATEAWNLSAGYRWSPTPMRDFSGPANVLDAGTHIVGFGVSHRLPGGDVLPVFSPDGKQLMWTSTRTADHQSQLFIADFKLPK